MTRVLFEHGDGQLAVDLLLSESRHSFAGMRRAGATTLWEYWPHSLKDRSHNHPMFGAVAAYLYDYLLGIRAKDGCAGYGGIVVSPVIVENVNQLSGYRKLPKGRVSVAYEKTDDGLNMKITVPGDLPAVLSFGGKQYELCEGENRFSF